MSLARLDSLEREYLVEAPLHPHEALARALLGPRESTQLTKDFGGNDEGILGIVVITAIGTLLHARPLEPKMHLTR